MEFSLGQEVGDLPDASLRMLTEMPDEGMLVLVGLEGLRDVRPDTRGTGAGVSRVEARSLGRAEGAVSAAPCERRVALRVCADGIGPTSVYVMSSAGTILETA